MSNIGKRRVAAQGDGGASYLKRREQIRQAAAAIFRERGYHGTAMSEVADVLGIDRASLYYYIGGKEELFQEVVRDALIANAEESERIADGDGPAVDRLRILITALMVSYEAHYPYLYVFIQEDLLHLGQEGSTWASEMSEYGNRYARSMVKIVRQGLSDGTLNAIGEPGVIASSILGMINWTYRWFVPGGHHSAAGIADSMSKMVLNGLAAQPDSPS